MPLLKQRYGIPADSVTPTATGSGSSYVVRAGGKRWIAKTGEQYRNVAVYHRVCTCMEGKGFAHSAVQPALDGGLATPEGVVLYQFLEGETVADLTPGREENAVRYLGRYHRALEAVPFAPDEVDSGNPWVRAQSVDYLVTGFWEEYGCRLPGPLAKPVWNGISLLRRMDGKACADGWPKQLIHGDPGPDNFLWTGDRVAALVDFTPAWGYRLTPLCHFIYWNDLWPKGGIPACQLRKYLEYYSADDRGDMGILTFLLLHCTLYRLAAPWMQELDGGRRVNSLERRTALIRAAGELLEPGRE